MRGPIPPRSLLVSFQTETTMRSGLLVLLASCALAAPVVAQDDTGSTEATELTAEELVEELIDEYTEAQQAFYKKIRAADTDEDRDKIIDNDAPDSTAVVAGLMKIASDHKGSGAAFTALNWVVQNAEEPATSASAIDTIIADHIENAELKGLCSMLQRNMSTASGQALEKILAGSPHDDVRGQACYSLASQMNATANMARKLQDGSASEDYLNYYTKNLGEERMAELQNADVKALAEQAVKLYERVVAEFGDIENRRGTLGSSAERALFELKNLQIGMLAPEIEAGDLDGVSFKLSDYRGKVVVLDFWGDW